MILLRLQEAFRIPYRFRSVGDLVAKPTVEQSRRSAPNNCGTAMAYSNAIMGFIVLEKGILLEP